MDAKTALLVAGAVGAPSLLTHAARAGVPIPAYVTGGQRAALAQLDAANMTGDEQVYHRFNAFNQGLIATQGAAPGHANMAKLSPEQLESLCVTLLDAAHAGIFADAPPAECYLLMDRDRYGVNLSGITTDLRAVVWAGLQDADLTELTDFGAACARVMSIRDGVQSKFLSSPQDMLSGNLACGLLAVEMDDQGYLISGKPEEKTLGGAFKAMGSAVVDFAADASKDAAKKLLGELWDIVKDEPLFWGAAGFVTWRLVG